jgi:hypothetical protein
MVRALHGWVAVPGKIRSTGDLGLGLRSEGIHCAATTPTGRSNAPTGEQRREPAEGLCWKLATHEGVNVVRES